MNRYILFLLVLLIAGCSTVTMEKPQVSKGFINKEWLREGMTKEEAFAVVGKSITIGYAIDPQSKSYNPVKIINPYRAENLRDGDKKYEVYYVFSGVVNADDIVADDELMPLIFEDNNLVGFGLGALTKIKNRSHPREI